MPDRNGAMTYDEVVSAWQLEQAEHRLTRNKYRVLRRYIIKANTAASDISKDILLMIIENDDIPEDES